MSASPLTYNGLSIHERGEMLSLTDMWRAAGSPEELRPAEWRRYPRTEKRANHIATTVGLSHSQLFQALNEGGDWNTWAHWALAIEYAEDLSVEMWFWAKTAIREKMERHRAPVEALPAVVAAEPRAFEVAIERLATLVQSGFELYGREISEVRQDVRAIHTRMTGIEARIEEVARRGRRRIKDSVKGEITRHTGLLGGRCPCCGVRTVVVDGWPAPHAEFDHFYANSAADAEHVWLICIECHADLTRHVAKRDERNAEFQAFQSKRRRLPGAQMRLIEAA